MKPLKAPNDIPQFDSLAYGAGGNIVSSPKLDGNRGLCIAGSLVSSSMKEPRNRELYQLMDALITMSKRAGLVFDYEIYSPSASHHAELSGIINSYDLPLPEDTKIYLFDCMAFDHFENECRSMPYRQRISLLDSTIQHVTCSTEWHPDLYPQGCPFVVLPQRPVIDAEHAEALFKQDLEDGYEGSMLRTLDIWMEKNRLRGGWYKHGRATTSERIIWKQKFFATLDGSITKVIQRRIMKEDWPRSYNASGHLIRPLEKDAYTLTDMVGAFEVAYQDPATNELLTTEIGFGKGFDHLWRTKAWHVRDAFVGRWVEFAHQPHGAQEGGKARIGRLIRFREDLDA